MKTWIAVFCLFVAPLAHADFQKNPDKTLSIGLDFTASRLNNAFPGLQLYDPARGQNLVIPAQQSVTDHFVTADVRFPVSESVTIDTHGGSWTRQAFGGTGNGYTVGAGVRYYFHGGD